ncbi:MAG TPA: enoyl-CoA hydratase-related protein [Candidatus Binatia bacterium]|nr:enoyl-CoA hydratase-related protein [Candidatus Binatia bacterium]
MTGELHDTCANLDADPGVRVLVLKGAGDRAFASGTDIRQFLDFKTREDALGYEARLTRVLARPAGMSKPTIAMLQGDAIGGGLFIALACDLRLAAPHARFGVPVARTLGNFLAPLSLSLLVAALGPSRAVDPRGDEGSHPPKACAPFSNGANRTGRAAESCESSKGVQRDTGRSELQLLEGRTLENLVERAGAAGDESQAPSWLAGVPKCRRGPRPVSPPDTTSRRTSI